MPHLGKILVFAGLILLVAGLVIWFFGDKFSWFGNLPGDIKSKGENFSFYAPITSMLLISIVLSFLVWLIGKIIK